MFRGSSVARASLIAGVALLCTSASSLAASDGDRFDINSQIGPNPVLPEVQQYLFPPMHLAPVVGWKDGEKPIVADGLKIEALATGLQHPRSLYVLPNGDVLIVQSKQPWPDPVQAARRIWSWAGSNPGSLRRRHRAKQPHNAAARR